MQVKGKMKKSILALGLGMIIALTQVAVFPVEMMTVKAETEVVVGELTGNAECYTSINVTEEGTEITYIPGTWHTLECTVAGHDVTKQG